MKKGTMIKFVGFALMAGVIGAQAAIVFEFDNGTPFDDVGAGATMSATNLVETSLIRTMTSVSVTDALGTNANTNIKSSWNAIGIRGGADNFSLELGETWVFDFDDDVKLVNLDMAGVNSGGGGIQITLSSSAFAADIVYNADGNGDTIDLGNVIVSGGTDITLTTSAVGTDLGWRLNEMTVEAIPEPATLGLFVLSTIGALVVRRFRM